MYTASTAFLEALVEAGVSYIFANFGSDHPALVEAIAEARASGRKIPQIITSPYEMVGMCAAHGHTLVSGETQAVVVHVDCGTQNLGGAIHNAAKGRTPVLVFAGLSPVTQEGEYKGTRNEFIQWIQDVPDQRSIFRGYAKYDNEFRVGANIKQITHRAMQIANSDPRGPAYLVGGREAMEEEIKPVEIKAEHWKPMQPSALPPAGVAQILKDLQGAKRPLVITSFLGRNNAAVGELVKFCEAQGIGVLESVPSAVNFPHGNPLYQGNVWNQPFQNPVLAEADVILVIDSDVPWIPLVNRPAEGAIVHHIDVDPLKESMTLWYIPATTSFRAHALTALQQLNEGAQHFSLEPAQIEERQAHYRALHKAREELLVRLEAPQEILTTEYLMSRLRPLIADDSIVMSEGVTNFGPIFDHLAPNRAGAIYTSGAGSLGWGGGAAIGAKLAAPDKLVVQITGDGSYMFAVPSSVHWMAGRYKTPFLQIVLNNGGWNAPRHSALAVHPTGYASKANDLHLSFDPAPKYAQIAAAAGGAWAREVTSLAEVDEALAEAIRVVREEGRCAVLDVTVKGS